MVKACPTLLIAHACMVLLCMHSNILSARHCVRIWSESMDSNTVADKNWTATRSIVFNRPTMMKGLHSYCYEIIYMAKEKVKKLEQYVVTFTGS